jgi:hypothetical protein
MTNQLRERAGMIYNIVESVILAMSVGLMLWVANIVIQHGNELARQISKQEAVEIRITRIETSGSASSQSHAKDDDTRISSIKDRLTTLEAAVVLLQSTPGELKAIGVKLETMHDSQQRIEERLDKITK